MAMRRMLGILAVLALISATAKEGRAQTSFSAGDPFFLYYGYFLPRQAAMASQPRVEDTINAASASQQSYAQTNRTSLYDPNGGYGSDRFADTGFLDGRGRGRPATTGPGGMTTFRSRASVPNTNVPGTGPQIYFNRTATYFPQMRPGLGRGPNRNLAVAGRGVRNSGVGVPTGQAGMPSPGPR
jgi:hypothetical protein